MAKQDPRPPVWHSTMSDGCTWCWDWLPGVGDMTEACVEHDRAFHYGGSEIDFENANNRLRDDIASLGGWFATPCAAVRYKVVSSSIGRRNFNWLGPGLPENWPQSVRYAGDSYPLG